ncbi:MAG: GGDEF domain-containing protein [Burkholderiaceae bacterium]
MAPPRRVGGEEFALVLIDVDGSAAAAICERIRAAIARHSWSPLHAELRVTMSLGLAWSREHDDSPASLIARTDAALYRAKTAGRNRGLTEFI